MEKNLQNVVARKAKGLGVINQISAILEDFCFGPYHIEIDLILRSSLLVNSVLTNCEVCYGLTMQDVRRKLLEAPSSSPKCMLYLETELKPIRFVIKMRRLMFLQYVLKEDSNSLISKFFHAQDSAPQRNDWSLTCRKDLEELNLTFKQIGTQSKNKFKELVAKAITKMAFTYLLTEKAKLSKVSHIKYTEFKIQEYFAPNVTSLKSTKFLYHARSRILDVRKNYKNKYNGDLLCQVCGDLSSSDDQEHLL